MDMTAAGSVGYTVQNLARLGLSVRVSSCLPDDPLGIFIEDTLRRAGVDTGSVQRVRRHARRDRRLRAAVRQSQAPADLSPADASALADRVRARRGGSPAGCAGAPSGRLSALSRRRGTARMRDLFQRGQTRGLITRSIRSFRCSPCRRPGCPRWTMCCLTWISCSATTARRAASPARATSTRRRVCLLDAGVETVVIKQGADGSTVYQPSWQYHQAAIILGEVEDTIGAGDAYDAGFLYGTLQGWTLEDRALFASVAAGFTVTGVGGAQTMPDLPVILAEMENATDAADRWLEMDLTWFDPDADLQPQIETLVERIAPLLRGVEGWRGSVLQRRLADRSGHGMDRRPAAADADAQPPHGEMGGAQLCRPASALSRRFARTAARSWLGRPQNRRAVRRLGARRLAARTQNLRLRLRAGMPAIPNSMREAAHHHRDARPAPDQAPARRRLSLRRLPARPERRRVFPRFLRRAVGQLLREFSASTRCCCATG